MRSLIKPAEAATCFTLRVLNKLQFISSFKLCHLHQISIQHAEPSVLKGTSQSIEMSFKKTNRNIGQTFAERQRQLTPI